MIQKFNFLLFITLSFSLMQITAQTAEQNAEGGEDHPLISRYPGSAIYFYDMKEFDEYIVPVAPLTEGAVEGELTEAIQAEGKITRIQYRVKERSTLEVYRNFESALEDGGFEILFEEHGTSNMETGKWVRSFYDKYGGQRAISMRNPSFVGNEFRYLASRLEQPGGDIYVSLYITTRNTRTTIQLDVIESAPMGTDMINVDADYLLDNLERKGFIALDGIYFETDEATMTDESKPALEEIVRLLEDNPKLDFYIVGHTDNVGAYDYNKVLSKQRAESVVNKLSGEYGISESRLQPVGVGPVAPVASNARNEGKANNRRVELVIK